jgi:uncharacterized protein YqhQ
VSLIKAESIKITVTTMSNKLNEEYFETKKNFRNAKKKKLTLKRGIINILVSLVVLFVFNSLNKDCSNRIKENEKNTNEIMTKTMRIIIQTKRLYTCVV